MSLHIAWLRRDIVTVVAFILRGFSDVPSKRLHDKICIHIFVLLFSTVRFQMSLQIACMIRGIITLAAFVRLFSTVCFQVSPHCTWVRACIAALIAFV